MTKTFQSIICFLALTSVVVSAYAQTDFEKFKQQQQQQFSQYKQQEQQKFQQYRDSVNRSFAAYLEKEWVRVDLQKPEPIIKSPFTVPPKYDKTNHRPSKNLVPMAPIVAIPFAPQPLPLPHTPKIPKLPSVPAYQKSLDAVFFGTDISLKDIDIQQVQLSSIDEKDVAKYWSGLVNIPYGDIINEANNLKTELQLNDWGLYKLLETLFETYFPQRSNNEKVIFTVFMLNQMGYKAKIGKSETVLLSLIVFNNRVTNTTYFTYADQLVRYYVMSAPTSETLSSVKTCKVDYTDAVNGMNLEISIQPNFAIHELSKSLTFGTDSYPFKCNKNMVDFYTDYPHVPYPLYVEAPIEALAWSSIEAHILPKIINKPEEEVVNFLLHFVQNAFAYKTDGEQFGYEKTFFAEETLASSYSDCEDRAILFAQLIRRIVKLPVVLIRYPGHLATAVRFNSPTITGDYVTIDGAKYFICDPTYINADLGMAMPKLKDIQIEVLSVKTN